MPTDKKLDQFPLPPQSDDSPSLTDPIVQDISASPKTDTKSTPNLDSSPTESKTEINTKKTYSITDTDTDTPPQESETEKETNNTSNFEPKTVSSSTPPTKLKPASLPSSNSKTLFTIIFLLLAIAGISTAIFLYTQNNQLKDYVTDLNSDLQQQQISERASLPQSGEDESTTATSEASFTIPTTSPTPISVPLPSSLTQTFSIFTPLFELATSKYPDAQLLLVSASNLQQDSPIIKYYFRQQPDKVKYFYILNELETGLSLFDQQVWVSPDNNIPSLNDRAKDNKLGIDLDTTLNLTKSLCSEKHSTCNQATSIKAQLIDSNVTLWQITYQLPNSSSPLVYQINSQTQNIIFRSDN